MHKLLFALTTLLASATLAREDGWDAVVDLDRETSCRPIVAALQPLLEGSASSRFVKVTGSLTGSADALGVPVLYRTGGARPGPPLESKIRACVPLIPTTRAKFFRGAPVADGSSLSGAFARIHFENVELRVRCEGGQSRDFVALFLGAGWLAGYEAGSHEYAGGTISGGVQLSGFLRVHFEGDCDGGQRAGVAPELRPETLLSQRGTGRTVMFVNGLMRSDLTKLTLDATGWPARDHDDTCVIHHHSWGVRVQGLRCGEFGGGGVLALGSADSSYRDVYVTANAGPGIAFGTPARGGAISSFAAGGACVGDDGDARDGVETCGTFVDSGLSSLQLSGVVEGNAGGNLLVFGTVDRVRVDFRGEGGAHCSTPRCDARGDRPMRAPNLGLFGGVCVGGARDGLPGFVDSVFAGPPRNDCPGGRLAIPETKFPIGTLRVTGEVGGDRGFDGAHEAEPDWNGIDLGAGFRSGSVRLAASVSASDVGCSEGCDDSRHDPRWLALLGADSDATGTLDLTGYARTHPRTVIGPYPFVRHDAERWTLWRAGASLLAPTAAGDFIAHSARLPDPSCELEWRADPAVAAVSLPKLATRGGTTRYVGRPVTNATVLSGRGCQSGQVLLIPAGN
ncbi:MAG: hypothetical protein FJ091_15915 [Deltaproteobacteria bacterium]|nr:hypothetical protein [Deltaproteobacteria bacterium]